MMRHHLDIEMIARYQRLMKAGCHDIELSDIYCAALRSWLETLTHDVGQNGIAHY